MNASATKRFMKSPLVASALLTCACILASFPSLQAYFVLEPKFWQQPWRLFTTHLVHLNQAHLLFNLLGLWLFSLSFNSFLTQTHFIMLCFISAFTASLSSIYWGQDIYFVGFSGVLHGFFAYTSLRLYPHYKALSATFCFLLCVKISVDFISREQELAWLNGAQIAVWCHFGGALGGLLSAILLKEHPSHKHHSKPTN